MRFNKLFRKVFAAVSAVTLIVSGMPVGLGVTAKAECARPDDVQLW